MCNAFFDIRLIGCPTRVCLFLFIFLTFTFESDVKMEWINSFATTHTNCISLSLSLSLLHEFKFISPAVCKFREQPKTYRPALGSHWFSNFGCCPCRCFLKLSHHTVNNDYITLVPLMCQSILLNLPYSNVIRVYFCTLFDCFTWILFDIDFRQKSFSGQKQTIINRMTMVMDTIDFEQDFF